MAEDQQISKKELRQRIRAFLASLPPEELRARSAAACKLLCDQDVYRRAEVVMLFLSTPNEVDTSQLALQAWADFKRVLAPRIAWDQRRMMPIEIHSLTSGVQPGLLGISEPSGGMPEPIEDIDLVVVPGLAFDEQGNRLGRGAGMYDRFLSHRNFHGVSCALALEEQVVPVVPANELDVKVQMLVTDRKVRRFKR